MDTLKELVTIVNRKRLSKIDVFDKVLLSQSASNLYYKLYEGLESGKITDDASAASYIYGSDDKDAKYRKLKSRFKNKLQKTLLLLDTEEVFINNQSRAYYECLLNSQIIEIIIKITGTTKLVYELAKENYSKAEQYNFNEILKNYSYYLLSYYAIIGDQKSFSKEEQLYLKYLDLSQKEQYAKFLYFKASIKFENQAPITDALIEEVRVDVEALNKLRLELQNIEIDFYYFFLALDFYQRSNQINKLIEVSNSAEDIMTLKPSAFTYTRKTIIYIYKLAALLSNKQYDEVKNIFNNIEQLNVPEGNYNWYLLQDIHFKTYLQCNDIENATKIYETVVNGKSFKRQNEKVQEKWIIYHAYLVFMDNYIHHGDYKFSLAKFINTVPVNSRDKSGFNFAIRIIEILFNAARNDFELIFLKMDALRIYKSRYLNDNTYKRNHILLNLLLKAEKSGFSHKVLVNADWKEITDIRKQNANIVAEWEIMPYEILWDIFVEFTKKE